MAKLGDLKQLLNDARARRDLATAQARGPSSTQTRAQDKPPPSRPLTPKRAVANTKHADGDVDLSQAFADVKRLPPSTRARIKPPPPSTLPMQRLADERDALLASKYGSEPSPQSWDIGQELESGQTFVRTGLGTDVLAKLRRGHWTVQGELDLHGLTSEEAHDALADFLYQARLAGSRCVRVVHGKGLSSPNREPVLKGKVRRWLSHWDDVLAYSEAPRHAGGGGAVLILLRGK